MIKTHFFGKDCIIDRALISRENLALNLKNQQFIFQNILLLNQVHGKEVVTINDKNKIYGDTNLPKADGIVCNLKEVVLVIVTADCSPILLFDNEKKVIGACHAGWRGARAGVISQTIKEMRNLGADNISALIGPMIQQKSYEISLEFYDDFINEDIENKKFFEVIENSQKMLFDLCGYVQNKLRAEGISAIENLAIDTYQDEKNYFSFRRSTHQSQADSGRNLAVIAIN
jgi:YfiH family protein